jgi:hypothetical protein
MKLGIATAVVAVALASASCSGGGPARTPAARAPSAAAAGDVTVTPAGDIAVGSGSIGPIRLGDRALVYTYAAGEADWDTVEFSDLETGRTRAIAHSEFETGLINWVATTGRWAAYVDQSSVQGNSDPDVLWRVHAVDVDTGANEILASNGDRPDPYVPIVHGADGYFFWTQAEADRTAQELVWRVGAAEPVAILRHAEMTPGSETLSDGNLVYLGPAAERAGQEHTVGGDCWQLPITGGTPEPLTSRALVMSCAARGGQLAWTQHIDPTTKDLPSEGILDNPYELWAEDTTDREPRLLHRGYITSGDPAVGDGFVLWENAHGVRVVQSLHSGKPHPWSKTKGDSAYQPAVASGSYAAHASGGSGAKITIFLYRITTSG